MRQKSCEILTGISSSLDPSLPRVGATHSGQGPPAQIIGEQLAPLAGPLEFCISWCTHLGFLSQASCFPASGDLVQAAGYVRLLENDVFRTEARTPAQTKYRSRVLEAKEKGLLGLTRFTPSTLALPTRPCRSPYRPFPELGRVDLTLHLIFRTLVRQSLVCSHGETSLTPQ